MLKLWLLIALPIAALDQWVKRWAYDNLFVSPAQSWLPPPRTLIPGVDLVYVENTGAAFGLLGGGNARLFLIAVSALTAAAIVLAVCKSWICYPFSVISISCVLGGAIGNLTDRILQGYVVDMFEFTFIRFAVFNVADIFITVGGACFILSVLLDEKRKKDAALDENG
jgi:signal peptidase II